MVVTPLNLGANGIWTASAPDGVAITPTIDSAGMVTALNISVDYSYANFTSPTSGSIESITFTGPVTDPVGTAPAPGAQFPGFRLPTSFAVANDLGVPINGYGIYLSNQNLVSGPVVPDLSDVHPNNYAHFHGVTGTSLVDAATGVPNASVILYEPNFGPGAPGPVGATPAPNFIYATSIIGTGATEQLKTFTLHSESTPGPYGGSFSLNFYAGNTVGTPVPPTPPVSPNNMFAAQGVTITDAGGNQWTIQSGQVVVNGVVDQTTSRVLSLAYENGQVWQMNADRLWWTKTSPSDAWAPTAGTSTSPLTNYASANNSVLNRLNPTGAITDANNDHWTISATGQVAVNGVIDQTTGRVEALAYENGSVWQVNGDGLWWSKINAAASWAPVNGTLSSPVQPTAIAVSQVVLPAGITTLAAGQDNSDSFVFAGVNAPIDISLPTLQFLGTGNSVISALIVNGAANALHFGTVEQLAENVEDDGGFQINHGRVTDTIGGNHALIIGANSTLSNSGSLFAGGNAHATVQIDATITVGAAGFNELYLNDVNVVGGTIIQNGESDITYVGGTAVTSGDDGSVKGTDFQINGGTLDIAWPAAFNGTIGSGVPGTSAIGIFGEVDIENAMAVARGSFDTTTGILSLLDATGTDLGDFHFAGNGSGLVLDMKSGGVMAINDHPTAGQGNIALSFHG